MEQYRTVRKETGGLSLTDLLQFATKWTQYKTKFNKKYDAEEEELRKKIFFQRYSMMQEHNKKFKQNLVAFKIEPTELTDQTEKEISFYYFNTASGSTPPRTMPASSGSRDSEWTNFKQRNKRKFTSTSEEQVPRLYFYSKLEELAEFQEYLRSVGLSIDVKDMDKYCDFSNAPKAQTMINEELDLKVRRMSSMGTSRPKRRKSTIMADFRD